MTTIDPKHSSQPLSGSKPTIRNRRPSGAKAALVLQLGLFGVFFAFPGGTLRAILKHVASHCVDPDLIGSAFTNDIEGVAKAGATALFLKFLVDDPTWPSFQSSSPRLSVIFAFFSSSCPL